MSNNFFDSILGAVSSNRPAAGSPLSQDPPSWEQLQKSCSGTEFGKAWNGWQTEWAKGAGPPHTDAKLRLFGAREEDVRLTLYRDTAAWCPYCKQVWMMLEEKQIPYRVVKINMRSYGEKPASFLNKVPNGLLPAIELDGRLMTESLAIMQTFEVAFPETKPMLPDRSSPEFERAVNLLQLERELFGRWCQLVFRPSPPNSGIRQELDRVLMKVDSELAATPGPWFLGGDGPGLVDLTYVPHLERMAASCAYWKGFQIRGNPRYANINAWFEALELRPSYMATKSDFYTHVTDIPPQYGDGHFSQERETTGFRRRIEGVDGSWHLPLPPLSRSDSLEPVLAENDRGDECFRHEAALKLASNGAAVAKFACRGAGRSSGWSLLPGRAPLSDPKAQPNEAFIPAVESILRHVTATMLDGSALNEAASAAFSGSKDGTPEMVRCLEYLRDRVGVPRDMSYPAALQLRAHLNWAIDNIKS
ncbi:putative glutathione S-transferase [Tribonema minus]|uniref:Putative glutathione S-transferase n=1 Tax=Tribonema minus TaxID=303371 RepID=A0A835ZBR3_9STRA|nr:putative glutathione S-transferase [Tribonema minus]